MTGHLNSGAKKGIDRSILQWLIFSEASLEQP